MSRKLVHSFGHLAENSYFRHLAVGLHHLALIEKLRLWSPRARRKKNRRLREVTKAVHLFSRHFWLSWPGGAELGKMSFTIELVYENYNF